MALHKKLEPLFGLNGDVMVIQECSKKAIESVALDSKYSVAWFGLNQNKGLGIIIKTPWKILESNSRGLNLISKIKLTGPSSLDLYAVWTCESKDSYGNYVGQVHGLLDYLESQTIDQRTIIVGDFNSNSIWDQKHGELNHSAAVRRFKALGLESAYHTHHSELQGSEKKPTLFFRKKREATYHIDYAFLSAPILDKLKDVKVGTFDDWIRLSDHVPLILEIDL